MLSLCGSAMALFFPSGRSNNRLFAVKLFAMMVILGGPALAVVVSINSPYATRGIPYAVKPQPVEERRHTASSSSRVHCLPACKWMSQAPQTLAAGATFTAQSSGSVDLLTGSAQLSTTGNVSGFVIFRHNDQEAAVPWESRTANAYILAFDNTNGTATGVAVNSVSAQSVNIPVVVRDDTGTQIATDTLNLAPNGHLAFTLAVDKYPTTSNIRGTIEFDTPLGAQIGALGIRIPVAHTFTSLPSLAK